MSARLPSAVLVSAMIRRVGEAGGSAAVLAKGDPQGGAILVIIAEKGRYIKAVERGIGPDGCAGLITSGPAQDAEIGAFSEYWQRRRTRDPDLWVLELDIPFAERFAAETIAGD